MLLPLQGALSIDSYTQGVALGYVLMPLRGVSTYLTEEPYIWHIYEYPHAAPLRGLHGVSDERVPSGHPPK